MRLSSSELVLISGIVVVCSRTTLSYLAACGTVLLVVGWSVVVSTAGSLGVSETVGVSEGAGLSS